MRPILVRVVQLERRAPASFPLSSSLAAFASFVNGVCHYTGTVGTGALSESVGTQSVSLRDSMVWSDELLARIPLLVGTLQHMDLSHQVAS